MTMVIIIKDQYKYPSNVKILNTTVIIVYKEY